MASLEEHVEISLSSDSEEEQESIGFISNDDELQQAIEKLSKELVDPNWEKRQSSLKDLATLAEGPSSLLSSFVERLSSTIEFLEPQLSERRSALIKTACSSFSRISKALQKRTAQSHDQTNRLHFNKFVSKACEALLPQVAVTTKAIRDPALNAISELVEHAATVFPSDNDTLVPFLSSSCSHKHYAVRQAAFSALATFLKHLPSERQAWSGEEDAKDSALLAILTAVESVLSAGLQDGQSEVRTASRDLLLQLNEKDPQKVSEFIDNLPLAAQKSAREELKKESKNEQSEGKEAEKKKAKKKKKKKASLESKQPDDSDVVIFEAPTRSRGSSLDSDEETLSQSNSSTGKKKKKKNKKKKKKSLEDEYRFDDEANDSDASESGEVVAQRVREQNIQQLYSLLAMNSPILADRVLDLLHQDGVLEACFSLISRLPSNSTLSKLVEGDFGEVFASAELNGLTENERKNYQQKEKEIEEKITSEAKEALEAAGGVRCRPKPQDEEDINVRRSFRVMQLLLNTVPNHRLWNVLLQRFEIVVKHLLAVAHPLSQGNFYHAAASMSRLLQRFPSACLSVILSKEGQILFPYLFDCLHEAPVSDLILTILTTQSQQIKKKFEMLKYLQQINAIPKVVDQATNPKTPEIVSVAAADFLAQFLERSSTPAMSAASGPQHAHSDSLTLLLQDFAKPGQMVDTLLTCVSCSDNQPRPAWQIQQCASLLLSLMKYSEDKTITVADDEALKEISTQLGGAMLTAVMQQQLLQFASRQVTNPLHFLRSQILARSEPRLASLCTSLTGESDSSSSSSSPLSNETRPRGSNIHLETADGNGLKTIQFSSFKVDRLFSISKLTVLRLIVSFCGAMEGDCLPSLPQSFWAKLVDWFFTYKHNNFFLSAFRSLFLLLVRCTCGTLEKDAEKEKERKKEFKSESVEEKKQREKTREESFQKLLAFILDKQSLNFIGRAAEFYTVNNTPCSANGFLLEMFSHLRLTAEFLTLSSKNSKSNSSSSSSSECKSEPFIVTYLSSHEEWTKFLPVLRAETTKQATPLSPKPVQHQDGGMAQLLAEMGGLDINSSETEEFYPGIELGSTFAQKLGYFLPSQQERRISLSSTSSHSIPSRSASSSPSSSQKKKKKKQKKKKGRKSQVDEDEEDVDALEFDSHGQIITATSIGISDSDEDFD